MSDRLNTRRGQGARRLWTEGSAGLVDFNLYWDDPKIFAKFDMRKRKPAKIITF